MFYNINSLINRRYYNSYVIIKVIELLNFVIYNKHTFYAYFVFDKTVMDIEPVFKYCYYICLLLPLSLISTKIWSKNFGYFITKYELKLTNYWYYFIKYGNRIFIPLSRKVF